MEDKERCQIAKKWTFTKAWIWFNLYMLWTDSQLPDHFKAIQTVLRPSDHFKAVRIVYFLHICWTRYLHIWPTLVCKDAIEATQQKARMALRVQQWVRTALKRRSGFIEQPKRHVVVQWNYLIYYSPLVQAACSQKWQAQKHHIHKHPKIRHIVNWKMFIVEKFS